MADESKTPVPLADCTTGDFVVIRHRSRHAKNPDTWRLTRVAKRTPKTIEVYAVGKFMTTGRPYGLANRHYHLFNPTPDVLASVAETTTREVAAAAKRAAAEAERLAEDEAKARKAADWLAGRGAAELLAFLPVQALRDMWDTIEPRLETATTPPASLP